MPVIVCQNTLKSGYRFLVAWTLFRHEQADRPCSKQTQQI
nr:MAG TPA: hypothetical protein [Caudoviricetes sp.]